MKLSLWLYGPDVGWWLEDEGYDDPADAASALAEKIDGQWTGGAIVPDGKFPMPMCDACLKAGRLHNPAPTVKR